jgi:hypothetical protein
MHRAWSIGRYSQQLPVASRQSIIRGRRSEDDRSTEYRTAEQGIAEPQKCVRVTSIFCGSKGFQLR